MRRGRTPIGRTRVLSETGGNDELQGIVLMGSNAALADRSELENADWDCRTYPAEALEVSAKSMNGQSGRAVVSSDLFATAYMDVENKVAGGTIQDIPIEDNRL